MSSTTTTQLPSGRILAQRRDGIIHARGIPYAHANRFEPPRSIPPRENVLDCTQPATICPQDPSRLEKVMGEIATGHIQSEGCLHLSITAPENAKKVPVMVFFHGGAYVSGGGDLSVYSGKMLSAQEDVVVVSVTYRLSVFGYLRIPGVAPANLGLMDQIAALEWVQSNIAVLGGDADNVTIFGQSAGGDSVFCLLLAASTRGLFHRAIVQSAPFSWYGDGRPQNMADDLGEYASAQSVRVGATDATLSTADLLELKQKLQVLGAKQYPESILVFGTELGQPPLPPADKINEVLSEAAARIPIMIGWVKDEGTAFVADPSNLDDSQMVTKRDFVDGAQHYHQIISQHQKSPTYTFAWSAPDTIYGATHCIELAFLLGTPAAWQSAPMLGGEALRQKREKLGVQMKKLWAGYARGELKTDAHLTIDENFQYQQS